MTFIRAKEIPPGSGNWYDYEVETVHEGGKVIQRHVRYIGKSVKKGKPVLDATLTPIKAPDGESA